MYIPAEQNPGIMDISPPARMTHQRLSVYGSLAQLFPTRNKQCFQGLSIMSENKLVLTYFNARGRAELARLIMAQGDIDYQDKRVTKEEWATLKSDSPTGQLPMLQVDGVPVTQSLVIARFLAQKAGLMGTSDLEAAQSEMIVHTINDIINRGFQCFFEKDEERKGKLMDQYETEYLPQVTQRLEAILSKNGGQFLVGKQLTWADLAVIEVFGPEALPKHMKKVDWPAVAPGILDHTKKMMELPKIKSWIERRPKTDM